MGNRIVNLDLVRGAIARKSWAEAYEHLRSRDESSLGPEELEVLGDCAWWLTRIEEATAARQKAYAGYAAAGNDRRAAAMAVYLFHEHSWNDLSVATGWLKRAQRHLVSEPECAESGLLRITEAKVAYWQGDLEEAERLAETAIDMGQRLNVPDVLTLAIETLGSVLISKGRVREGLELFDEAMTSVMAGQLTPFFTGAVYCLVLLKCLEIAELRRAGAWTEAARVWCESLPSGTPYHGQCRLNRVEVVVLRGDWAEAEAEARLACEELIAFQPILAAKAFYWLGEVRRQRGDLVAAEEAFKRAHELGFHSQPGLALVRLVQGKIDAAAAALRLSMAGEATTPLARARFLSALAEVELAAENLDAARTAVEELRSLSSQVDIQMIEAMAAHARGALALAEGDAGGALSAFRRAWMIWQELKLPYEAARARLLAGVATRQAGDEETARLEIEAAGSAFERLGAPADARAAADLLGEPAALPGGLSQREAEVLRLVAAGKTNRDIAATLFISDRTVARHLSNIFTKLDVTSRAAATAYAFEHHLV